MSDKPNDGGPAFARPGMNSNWERGQQEGMTLRDYFAAKAMAALLTQPEAANNWADERVAEWAYNAADAMLAEREKGKQS